MVSPVEYYFEQVRLAEAAALMAARQWERLGSDLDKWPEIAGRLALIVSAAQVRAASNGIAYVEDEVGPPVAKVQAKSFGGWASDGMPLDSLLYGSIVQSRMKFGSGLTDEQVMAFGGNWLQMAVQMQVLDAGRGASGVAIAATPRTGWIRYVHTPCCQSCAVLAGKFFRWNQGFQRHRRCKCTHQPVGQGAAKGLTSNIAPDQIHDLTDAQRRAIADGADMNQVINAYRGVTPSMRNRMITTTEGTTRRGWASYVKRTRAQLNGEQVAETAKNVGKRGAVKNYVERRTKARPSPELIYAQDISREEAVRLLARHGYIVGDLKGVARLSLP
ncbi:hypothetical protein ATK74_1764 [Propionicimonas paludicola]|uniref:Uncharacterized protein n=1 Tax=Propionicimonas paludicola TaxID=185243 RepID=A0A2A9CSP1_9ACTN|nr:hypothetical protein [Propionicimonas paludicola]PFG17201.1 hypothetical protein ATK74_1764 [Propionicimonas paludicola]